jgi:hypothetical protein
MGMHCDVVGCEVTRPAVADDAFLRRWERIYDQWDAKFDDGKVSLRKPRHAEQ